MSHSLFSGRYAAKWALRRRGACAAALCGWLGVAQSPVLAATAAKRISTRDAAAASEPSSFNDTMIGRAEWRASIGHPDPSGSGQTMLPTHPWRLCANGLHWERGAPHAPWRVVAGGHCAENPEGIDVIYPGEMRIIAARHFPHLSGGPAPTSLGFSAGRRYDTLIRGWTDYWNTVLQPAQPLDPDMVKALIASESGFRPDSMGPELGGGGRGRGLMQLTDQALDIMRGDGGELKDHLVVLGQGSSLDPNLNIAAGIRWLFHKRAKEHGDDAEPWRSAVAAYKACPDRASLMRQYDGFLARVKRDRRGLKWLGYLDAADQTRQFGMF